MNGLLDQNDIIQDLPSFYETSLIFRDNSWEQILESVSYNFGDDLVACVAQGDGWNLLKLLAPFSLGINARKEELVLPPSLVQFWDFLTILRRSFLIIGQQEL
jgi:hypothetical protein